MGRYKVNQSDGSLQMISGRGKAEYGASTVRKNTFNQVVGTGTFEVISIAFSTPMPDADYVVDFTFDNDSTTTAFSYAVSNKTASGFDITFGNQFTQAQRYKGTVTAFKLYTDTEYNEVLEKINGSGVTSLTDSIWTTSYANNATRNGCVVNITGGGVTASKVQVTANTTILAKVPEGYRPKVQTQIQFRWGATSANYDYISIALVKPNGDIVSETTQQVQYFMLQGCYGI